MTLLSLLFSQVSFAEDDFDDDFDSFDTEQEEPFNHGRAVGEASKDYLKVQRRTRIQNWTLAITSTLAGAATFVYVAKKR